MLSILSGKSLFPITVTVEKAKSNPLSRKRVSGQLMATTYSQLASLLRSGVPLLRSIHVLRQQTSNARLNEVLDDVYRRVEDGATLAEAMSRYPRVFSEMAINMVRAGGEGGFLEDALDRVAQFTEQQEDLKSRTAGALAYPVFLAIVGTLVVGGLVIFFVPRFAAMFDSLRQRGELPVLTDWLLWLSAVLRRYGIVVVVAAVVLLLMIRQQLETEKGKRWRDYCQAAPAAAGPGVHQPGRGPLLPRAGHAAAQRRADPEVAGDQPRGGGQPHPVGGDGQGVGEHLVGPVAGQAAGPLRAFSDHRGRDDLGGRGIEHAGRVLVEIADGLERRTVRRLDLAVRLLEPMMLLILAIVVLCVVIALLMPVIKMSSTIGHVGSEACEDEQTTKRAERVARLYFDGSVAGAGDPGDPGIDGRDSSSPACRRAPTKIWPGRRSACSRANWMLSGCTSVPIPRPTRACRRCGSRRPI